MTALPGTTRSRTAAIVPVAVTVALLLAGGVDIGVAQASTVVYDANDASLPHPGDSAPWAQRSASGAERAGGPTERVIGYSVEGRPIRATEWNRHPGRRPTLIICAIHGNERLSRRLGEHLHRRWRREPGLLQGAPVILVRDANPDGSARRQRRNARGVDINRNFVHLWQPSRWRRSLGYAGTEPLSEPETRALAWLIESRDPARIISVHEPFRMLNYDGPARDLARLMAKELPYPVRGTVGYPTPGSLGNFAGEGLEIPTVTLELPARIRSARHWRQVRAAILAAVRLPDPQPIPAQPLAYYPVFPWSPAAKGGLSGQ